MIKNIENKILLQDDVSEILHLYDHQKSIDQFPLPKILINYFR